MKIFGIGLSRTGTRSLTRALQSVGFKIIHFPRDQRTLEQLQNGDYRLDILSEYDGITDLPAAIYWQELCDCWADCRIIHTTRNADSWLASMEKHLAKTARCPGHAMKSAIYWYRAAAYGTLKFNRRRLLRARAVHEYRIEQADTEILKINIDNPHGAMQNIAEYTGKTHPGSGFPHIH